MILDHYVYDYRDDHDDHDDQDGQDDHNKIPVEGQRVQSMSSAAQYFAQCHSRSLSGFCLTPSLERERFLN